jgi:large subunit ribosomal protein L35Ae
MNTVSRVVGVILGYRKGSNKQYNNEVYVRVFTDLKSVYGLIGSKVIARDTYGNVYRGKVVKVHGCKNGVVVVRFDPGIPGQMIRSLVDIIKK